VEEYQLRVQQAAQLRDDEASRTRAGFQPQAPPPQQEELPRPQPLYVESQAPAGPPGPPPPLPVQYQPPQPAPYQLQPAPYQLQPAQPAPGWSQPGGAAPA
jgi:hypothetical protein